MNVELVKHSASDLDVVNAARVSYDRTTEHLGPEDVRLINSVSGVRRAVGRGLSKYGVENFLA